MNFGELFAKTLSTVQTEREEATRQLETAATDNFPMYAACLAQELASEQHPSFIRNAIGVALKNALSARDVVRREELANKWLAIDANTRAQIKSLALGVLASNDAKAGTSAAQVVAAIAAIELPRGQWPEAIPALLQNVANPQASTNLKKSSLETIGFIFEDIPPVVLQAQADQILTAVIQGARKEETNNDVRRAALAALLNSLEFIQGNFERENERNFIMQTVCEATTCPDDEVVSLAFQNLVRIMQLYYNMMSLYMESALYALTIEGMKKEDEKIALQAIEFWSTVCDEEIAIEEDIAEAMEFGETIERQNLNFARSALPQIVPTLLWLLTKQDEDADEDDWNISMAAGTCLSLLAQTVLDDIVQPVVPFVESNIRNQDWHFREAAVFAFGSILDGPNSSILQPLVSQALPVIVEMMQDPVVAVKDTAAWTLGRICEFHPDCIKTDLYLQNLMAALIRGLEDSPRVATNASWALMNLAQRLGSSDESFPTFPLSPFFELSVGALLACTARPDGSESNMRVSAYEALCAFIVFAAEDCIPVIQKTVPVILDRLDLSIQMSQQLVGADDKNTHAELQTCLCGVIQSLASKLGKDIAPAADRIMEAFLKIFTSSSKTLSIVEDVFMAVGSLIRVLENDFSRYMPSFEPFLTSALQNHEEYQLCNTAVGIVSDLCRAIGEQFVAYSDAMMQHLLQSLQSTVLHRDVKPEILSCFGDIALAIQSKFEPYLPMVMMVLQQASSMRADENDYEMIDYVNLLRDGILEAYTGIVQGFKVDGKANVLFPYVEAIFGFLHIISLDNERSESVVKNSVGLIGDMADAFGGHIKNMLVASWVEDMLKTTKANRGMTAATKDIAKWAKTMVKKAIA